MSKSSANPSTVRIGRRAPSLASLGALLSRFLLGDVHGAGASSQGKTPIAHPMPGFAGHTAADWGRSPQCARMVRKNRMRRLGIGADHR